MTPVPRGPGGRVRGLGGSVLAHDFERSTDSPDPLAPELLRQLVQRWTGPAATEGRVTVEFQCPGAHPGPRERIEMPARHDARRASGRMAYCAAGEPGGEHLDCGRRDQGAVGLDAPQDVALLIGDGDAPHARGRLTGRTEPTGQPRLLHLGELLSRGRAWDDDGQRYPKQNRPAEEPGGDDVFSAGEQSGHLGNLFWVYGENCRFHLMRN